MTQLPRHEGTSDCRPPACAARRRPPDSENHVECLPPPGALFAEAVDAAPVLLRRTARAAITVEQRGDELAWGRGRAVIDEAFGGKRCGDSSIDQLHDFEHAVAISGPNLDAIADTNRLGRFRSAAVDPDVAAPARLRSQRAGLEHSHRPQPLIDSCRLDGSHSVELWRQGVGPCSSRVPARALNRKSRLPARNNVTDRTYRPGQ
jgi:hypothetical protein